MTANSQIAVLLMAYGSPESLDDMGAYLLDVRGGRPTSTALVEEISHRYALIGGRSPLLELTRKQAAALKTVLNQRKSQGDPEFRTYIGMRHWEPRIAEAVHQIAADGIRQVVALVMAPHSSRMSTGMYFARLEETITSQGLELQVIPINSWHKAPGFIEAIARNATDALQLFKSEQPYIVFTAHSLPTRILQQGDPYDTQLRETVALVAERLGLPAARWEFSYQSAGQSPEPWLGPQIEDVVVRLAQSGKKNLLIIPVGFVCDHVEVLYDIDIAARGLAAQHGARLERSASLNDSPMLISALADLVFDAIAAEKQGLAGSSHPVH